MPACTSSCRRHSLKLIRFAMARFGSLDLYSSVHVPVCAHVVRTSRARGGACVCPCILSILPYPFGSGLSHSEFYLRMRLLRCCRSRLPVALILCVHTDTSNGIHRCIWRNTHVDHVNVLTYTGASTSLQVRSPTCARFAHARPQQALHSATPRHTRIHRCH